MSKRAILSVHDKEGLVIFARRLAAAGWDLVASGGTARTLRDAELDVTEISALTGAPEMLGGRVKTLHPAIHAGILARDDDADRAELAQQGYAPIDLVVCNLYPFAATVAQEGVTVAEAVEQIDIGGVTLLRAAAKNFARVAVVVDPADYERVARAVEEDGTIPEALRRELALKAFEHTRDYDTAIAAYLGAGAEPDTALLPTRLHLSLSQVQPLRYGENPHQAAALYAPSAGTGPLGGTLLQGKALSYNNLLDLDAAWQAALVFTDPAVVLVKHLCPCGIAADPMNVATAFPAALASDPVSAFGGVIAVNRPVEASFATAIGDADLFVEAVVAPSFSPAAQDWFAAHKPSCRLVALGDDVDLVLEPASRLELRTVRDGYLVQEQDVGDLEGTSWEIVTARQPSDDEVQALRFAWQAVTFVKSNAIVLATSSATVGIGGGLPSRIDAVDLAIRKAGARAAGAVMASDAFFPFPDGVEAAAAAGVTAVIQPGGSIRDDDVIAAADRYDMAMVFTGSRHFRH